MMEEKRRDNPLSSPDVLLDRLIRLEKVVQDEKAFRNDGCMHERQDLAQLHKDNHGLHEEIAILQTKINTATRIGMVFVSAIGAFGAWSGYLLGGSK